MMDTTTGRFHFSSHIHVREHWEDWYRRIDANFDGFLLTNRLRDFFETVMKDGTLGRKNRGKLTGVHYSEGSWPKLETVRSVDPGKLEKIRESIRSERAGTVDAVGFSRDNVFGWSVAVDRRGDEIGWYPNDQLLRMTWQGSPVSREFLGRSGDVMFEMFVGGLSRLPPFAGWLTLGEREDRAFPRGNGYANPPMDSPPFTAGYRWGLFVPNADIERLGGLDALRREAPVEEVVVVEPLDGTPSPGVATLIRRDVTTLTEDDVRAWKQYLLPVLDLKPPQPASAKSQPVDVLYEDWAHPDSPPPPQAPPAPTIDMSRKPKRPLTADDIERIKRGEAKLEDFWK